MKFREIQLSVLLYTFYAISYWRAYTYTLYFLSNKAVPNCHFLSKLDMLFVLNFLFFIKLKCYTTSAIDYRTAYFLQCLTIQIQNKNG